MKRLLSLLLILCLLPCAALTEEEEYLSLYEEPFILDFEQLDEVPEGFTGIFTFDDISKIAENPDGKFILMDNIHFPSGNTLRLVGFTGELNGNGYALTGVDMHLTLNPRDAMYIGLFGWIRNASISNLRLEGSIRISDSGYRKCRAYCGGIAGRVSGKSSIRNCVSFVDIAFDEDIIRDQYGYYGGITGVLDCDQGATISYCHHLGTISVPENAGGIAGCIATTPMNPVSAPVVYACMNTGVVSAKTWYGGGIVGQSINNAAPGNAGLTIASCANRGEVFAMNSGGGILGYANDDTGYTTVRDCLNEGIIATTDAPVSPTGGIVGNGDCYVTNCLNVGRVLGNPVSAIHTGVKDPAMLQNNYFYDNLEYASRPTDARYELTAGRLSAEQMQSKDSFPGFSFPAAWTLNEGMTHPFPTPLVLDYRWIIYSPDAWDSDVEDIRGNTVREQAIEDIMNSYEFTDDEIAGTIICFAEGYGAYPGGGNKNDRSSALCVVWKNGQIVFAADNCSTFPDYPTNPAKNPGSDSMPTLIDGKYLAKSTNHLSSERNNNHIKFNYPALKVYSVLLCRIRYTDHYEQSLRDANSTINIHAKSTESLGMNSQGCTVVGYGQTRNAQGRTDINADNEYSRFAYLVGFAKDADGDGRAEIKTQIQNVPVTCQVIMNRAYGYDHVPEFKEMFDRRYDNRTEAISFILRRY